MTEDAENERRVIGLAGPRLHIWALSEHMRHFFG